MTFSQEENAPLPDWIRQYLWHNKNVQFPLSQDEHAAIARYLAGIRKQLQDVSDLFRKRYGKGSEIAEEAVDTLAAVARLEHKFLLLENPRGEVLAAVEEAVSSRAN